MIFSLGVFVFLNLLSSLIWTQSNSDQMYDLLLVFMILFVSSITDGQYVLPELVLDLSLLSVSDSREIFC